MQASTAQRSPEATCRPWCAHDWAGAEGTVRGEGPLPIPHTGSRSLLPPPQHPHLPGPHLGISHSTCQPPAPSPSRGGRRGPGTLPGGTPRGPAEDRCHCSRDFRQGLESLASHSWRPSGSGTGAGAPSLSAPAPQEQPLHVQVGDEMHLQLLALTQGCPEGAPFSDYLEDPIFSGPVTGGSSLYPSLRSSTLTLPPPAHMAGASDTGVTGVLPALSICHSPALSFHHTF